MEKNKKDRKKIIILSLVLVIIAVIVVILINLMNKKNEVYIEIASNNIGYSYGPNSQTVAITNINDEIKITIISNKKDKVKCYSTNESVVSINATKVGTALSNGNADIYCKVGKTKSNIINVKVGD